MSTPGLPRTVAVLAPGVEDGAFSVVPPALAGGFCDLGVERVLLVRVHRNGRGDTGAAARFTVVDAGARRSALAPVALAKVLRRFRPDLSISMPATVNIAVVAAWIGAGRPGALILSEHAIMSHEAWEEHRGSIEMRALPWLARRAYPRASGLACVSSGVLSDLRDVIGVDFRRLPAATIPNPLDLDAIRARAAGEAPHEWLRDRSTFVGITVGRLARQKNVDLAVEAARRVADRVPFRLVVLGDGPERDRLQADVRRRRLDAIVAFPGHVDNPYPFMRCADVLVSPSREEAFCLPVAEALACGLPVVATDCAGPAEILAGGAGLLVPRDDPAALAETIVRLLADPELGRALRTGAPGVAAKYAPGRIAQRWLDFARSLPGGRSN